MDKIKSSCWHSVQLTATFVCNWPVWTCFPPAVIWTCLDTILRSEKERDLHPNRIEASCHHTSSWLLALIKFYYIYLFSQIGRLLQSLRHCRLACLTLSSRMWLAAATLERYRSSEKKQQGKCLPWKCFVKAKLFYSQMWVYMSRCHSPTDLNIIHVSILSSLYIFYNMTQLIEL